MPILSAVAAATARAYGFGLFQGAGATFTVVQTFTANSTWTCPAGVTSVEYLVVASGGGGGGRIGGGGGAGGFRTGTGLSVTAGTDYTITVGAGSAGGVGNARGTSGNDSTFSTITSAGGGGGVCQWGAELLEGARHHAGGHAGERAPVNEDGGAHQRESPGGAGGPLPAGG